jgi:hypothetical protein
MPTFVVTVRANYRITVNADDADEARDIAEDLLCHGDPTDMDDWGYIGTFVTGCEEMER